LAKDNFHATALILSDRGVLIMGPSGSGKTTLALALITRETVAGRFARLVSDDQLFVAAHGERLVATCPDTIAGLAEVHGIGPRPQPYVASAVIDLVVRLVPQSDAPRLGDAQTQAIAGISLPAIDLPARNAEACCLALAAWFNTSWQHWRMSRESAAVSR
jgi:serine kinase of HPr protein (carbohydrate metabolism regulator)